jgi:hypothetical protein
MTFEEADVQGKLGMCLTADLSNAMDLKVLDIMLLKGRGYQEKDMERVYEWLKDCEDFPYRRALGSLRDQFLLDDEKMSRYSFTDLDLLEGIVQLSYPQQICCAKNIIDRLEYADRVMHKMFPDGDIPEKTVKIMKEAEQMLAACRSLLKSLGQEE